MTVRNLAMMLLINISLFRHPVFFKLLHSDFAGMLYVVDFYPYISVIYSLITDSVCLGTLFTLLECAAIGIPVDMQLFDAPIRNAVLSDACTEMLIEHFGELSVRITIFDVLKQPLILFGCITMLTHWQSRTRWHVPTRLCSTVVALTTSRSTSFVSSW